ncbi:MAG: hypothetical protein EOP53_04940 [Sphingobacteriales bacterium]|nr:MAG: hypothetical protein EOP53_04940 [Sphingobacteriales bacterium]
MPSSKNSLKHLFWIIPLLLLLSAAAFVYYKYKTFQKPVILNVQTDAIAPGKSKIVQLNSTTFIFNPNNMEIHADSLRFVIYIDGKKYSDGIQKKGFTIKGNDTSKIQIPFTFDIGKFAKEFEKTQKDSGLHRIEGEMYVDVWKFNSVRIPFSFEKNMPVFKAPKPEILKVHLVKFGLKESIIETTVKLHNPNDMAIATENIYYNFKIGDEKIAEGSIPKDKFLPKEGSTTLTIPITFSLKEAVDEIGIFRKKYEGKNYSMRMYTEIKTESKDVPNIDFNIYKTGTMDELMAQIKEMKAQKKEEKKAMTPEERKEKRKEKRKKLKGILK